MKLPDSAVIASGTSITLSCRLVAVTTTSSSVWAVATPVVLIAADTASGSTCFRNAVLGREKSTVFLQVSLVTNRSYMSDQRLFLTINSGQTGRKLKNIRKVSLELSVLYSLP